MPAQTRPKPSPLLFRADLRRRALVGLWPSARVVYSTGWLRDDEETPPLPARLGDVLVDALAACRVGAFGVCRQDHP